MVPVRLNLKNFMCYHDAVPELDFDTFHVACLSGENGHGKSAILDAMTWALWGKARARSDDDLVYMGERDMEVQFEFAVGHERFRVIRKRSRGSIRRTGQSVLELQVATSAGFTSMSGGTIRETEKKIVDLLRMDYDTFINSALLLQGRADEFSMKRPGERKQVLANILGLSLYDTLEKAARGHSRDQDVRQRDLAAELARIEKQLESKPAYEAALVEAQAALADVTERLAVRESDLVSLRQSRDLLKARMGEAADLANRIDNTNHQIKYLDSQIAELNQRIGKCEHILSSYEENAALVRTRLQEVEKVENDLADKRGLAEDLSKRIHHLEMANATLKEEMGGLKKKVDLLDEDTAECPLCGTVLGEVSKGHILERYRSEGTEKGDAFRSNKAEIEAKESELKSVRAGIAKLESTARGDRTRYERQSEALERDRNDAENRLPQDRTALAQAEESVQRLRASLKEDTEKRDAVLELLEDLPAIEKNVTEAEAAHRGLKVQEQEYRSRLTESQAALRNCERLDAEMEEKKKAAQRAVEEKSVYDELAVAFGKKGVQALIIESVLPEIEDEANRLLGRMTDNRMHVKLESQKDTAKGETVETLDIRISDDLGTRNYEMYSGGEAFRVNFAVRIALAKLLARRAGAPLPTIIIDEGFGTQDSTGRERLVEAINSIQDDFEKIIVITHIEELKDAFPVRIEVTKGDDGSTFSVN
jgi:exonuclease SbcC